MEQFLLPAIIALSYLSFVAARPDASLGYQYQLPQSSSSTHFLQTSTSSGANYLSGTIGFGGVEGSTGFSDSSSSIDLANSGFESTSSDFYGSTAGSFFQQAPIVSKHFYVHNVPEDHHKRKITRTLNIGHPQKNYHVIFLNTPSSLAANAKVIANLAPVEEKTDIYVLAGKQNALDVSAEVVTPAPVVNKPDVFFIKYKTSEEAAHAQYNIQAQYDALGGSSDVINGGTIPVSSVIGSLGGSSEIDGGDQSGYLPPNHK